MPGNHRRDVREPTAVTRGLISLGLPASVGEKYSPVYFPECLDLSRIMIGKP